MVVGDKDFWESASIQERVFQTKLCLARSSETSCDSSVVRAHTIPRSQLRKIASDGHVYAIRPSVAQMLRTGGILEASKIGINKFSTLHCFCAKHDKEIFSDLEDRPLEFDQRQLSLLHYRALAAEHYKKMMANVVSKFRIDRILRKNRGRIYAERLEMLHAMNLGEALAIRDGAIALQAAQETIDDRIRGRMSALIIQFKRPPSIMTVGGFFPEFDFNGRALQQLGNEAIIQQGVTFHILSSKDTAALALVWFKGDAICESFARSLATQPTNLLTTLIIQTAFEHIENTCMKIDWWDRLKQVEQKLLVRRFQIAGSVLEGRHSNCLTYTGVTHDQWDFDSLVFANVDSVS